MVLNLIINHFDMVLKLIINYFYDIIIYLLHAYLVVLFLENRTLEATWSYERICDENRDFLFNY